MTTPLRRIQPGSDSGGAWIVRSVTGAHWPGRSAAGAHGTRPVARPGGVGDFDRWAASYNLSQLQTVLYVPVHDVVLRYAHQHIRHPRSILDVGCGTGRLPSRLVSGYRPAHVVGIDASTAMVTNALTAPVPHRPRFAAAVAEQLPFADETFDLVVVTLSLFHWRDPFAGLAEIDRVMTPGATLLAADVCAARPVWPRAAWARRSRPALSWELPSLIAAGGLRVEHVEPIHSVALIADAALVAARAPVAP